MRLVQKHLNIRVPFSFVYLALRTLGTVPYPTSVHTIET